MHCGRMHVDEPRHARPSHCSVSFCLFHYYHPQMPTPHQSFISDSVPSTTYTRTHTRPRISSKASNITAAASTTRPRTLSIPSAQVHTKDPSPTTTILPGKRGKATRLLLASFILFPPVAIFFLAMFPFILLISGTEPLSSV
jgi:hypothetical protein